MAGSSLKAGGLLAAFSVAAGALVRLQRRGGGLGRAALPAGCEIRSVDLGSPRRFMFEAVCAGQVVGDIEASGGRVRWVIRNVGVDVARLRRRGIATRLYETAAAEACRREAPLVSEARVGSKSTAFWEKQVRKGRARRIERRNEPPFYELPCPVPASLAGRRP